MVAAHLALWLGVFAAMPLAIMYNSGIFLDQFFELIPAFALFIAFFTLVWLVYLLVRPRSNPSFMRFITAFYLLFAIMFAILMLMLAIPFGFAFTLIFGVLFIPAAIAAGVFYPQLLRLFSAKQQSS